MTTKKPFDPFAPKHPLATKYGSTKVKPNTPEWLHERRKRLQGSDLGTLLRLHDYDPPVKIFEAKYGIEHPTLGKMQFGHYFEDAVCKIYQQYAGSVRLVKTDAINWMEWQDRGIKCSIGATVDRWEYDTLTSRPKRSVVEIKTSGFYGSKLWKNNMPPSYYYMQCQVQMMVSKTTRLKLVSQKDINLSLDVYEVRLNEDMKKLIKLTSHAFFSALQTHSPDKAAEVFDNVLLYNLGGQLPKDMVLEAMPKDVTLLWSLPGNVPVTDWPVSHSGGIIF